MKTIFPHQSVDEIMSRIDQFEDLSYRVVGMLLKKHNFEEEYYRLEEGCYIGVGKQRILTRLCLEFLDGSWSKAISFYETCNRENDEPHYEDLTTTLLVAFAAAFLANVASELVKVSVSALKRCLTKKSINRDATKTDVKMVFYAPVQYILLGTTLRDQHRLSQSQPDWDLSLTDEEYTALLGELRQKLGKTSKPTSVGGAVSHKTVDKFQRYCRHYFSQHGFLAEDPVDELLEEIISNLEKELQQSSEEEGER